VSLVDVVGAVVLIVLGFNVLTAFHSTAPTRQAYADNSARARIDALKARPQGLQSLGGNTSVLLGGRGNR